jgi:signal transduction histidine kinase
MVAWMSLWLAVDVAAAQAPQKVVVAIFAGGQYVVGAPAGDLTIQRAFGGALGVDYYAEYLDLGRFTAPDYEASVRSFLRAKYEARRVDLLLATSDSALAFLVRARDALFPGVPIVFATADDPGAVPNATGIIGRLDMRASLEVALRLRPDTARVAVVSGASEWDGYYEKLARQQFEPLEERIGFTYLSGLPTSDLLQQVAILPARSVIFLLTMVEDGAGRRYLLPDAVSSLTRVANAPVFLFIDEGLNEGAVGGHVLSPRVLLRHAAELGVRVLNGESPDTIPVREVDWAVNRYDGRALAHWGIAEAQVPVGSTILNRQRSAWDQYSRYILAGSLLVLVQAGLIGGLLFHRRRRLRVERALQSSHDEIQGLSGRLIEAQDVERARIARELHDDVSQQLGGLSIALTLLEGRLAQASAGGAVLRDLSAVQERAATLTQSVRNLSHDLHPQVLRRAGLADALRAYCAEIERRHTLALTIEVQGDRRSLPQTVASCLYRVAQETLRNVVRHSGARHADIRLVSGDHHVELTIRDDGEGFDIGEARKRGTGLGLVSVNERVRLAGGTVDISSAPRRGTQVRVCIPLDAPAANSEERSSGHGTRIA